MQTTRVQLYFFFGLFIIATLLTLAVLWPFLSELVVAMTLAVILGPAYLKLTDTLGGRKNIAALIMVIATCIIILAPLVLLGAQLLHESINFYDSVRASGFAIVDTFIDRIAAPFERFNALPEFSVSEYVDTGVNFIFRGLGGIFSGTFQLLLGTFLVLFSLFFFLKEGKKFSKMLLVLSPLSDDYDNRIIDQVRKTVNAVVVGALFIALLQGILLGIGLAIFGVPNPTLWGTLTAITALIPGLGTAIIAAPAVVYVFLTAGMWPAIGLLVWSAVLVGLVDNIVLPYFYGRGTEIHPLLILLSVLGGLVLFGPLGFLFGPLVVSLFLVLLDMYEKFIEGNTETT